MVKLNVYRKQKTNQNKFAPVANIIKYKQSIVLCQCYDLLVFVIGGFFGIIAGGYPAPSRTHRGKWLGSLKIANSRFVGRRGCPSRVHCDNATNFVGASRHLEELRKRVEAEENAVRDFASRSGCEFAFIPPRAPHFGGLWEAGVKSAKHLLLRTVGNALLTAEELQTVVVAVEAVLNSRPLGAVSNDPNDGEALTPGHLLVGGPLVAPAGSRTPDQEGLSCLRRWRAVSSLKRAFWQRWSREYVLGLQARAKWDRLQPNLRIGELVVVAEDNQPPMQWMVGRVVAVYPGADGAVRVADMRTSTGGLFKRPIHKLAPLPIG
ncbi:uncharacterized protein LOC127565054 [Drosophila albomicans]|uniref:Uncharacterized protein LOC127565054 n=1 Tax=Drosophila albomicans TaxID=7291 RepID=A0A9C6WFS8_DROAB|nr:uncharacterized protein LOC127565054 [Drosophila albomicans]